MRARRLQPGRKAPLGAERLALIAGACLALGACTAPFEGSEPQPHVGRSIQGVAPDTSLDTSSGGGGCSASGEPTHGAVEHALGIVAVLFLVLRLRSARRRTEEDARLPGGRVPYQDLGMRESVASLPDDL